MKDQSNTGETVYKNAAGKKISADEYRRLQSGVAEKSAGTTREKDEVMADDHGKDAGSSKG